MHGGSSEYTQESETLHAAMEPLEGAIMPAAEGLHRRVGEGEDGRSLHEPRPSALADQPACGRRSAPC
jgi:hypothetical protein